ncbi:MAG: AI-2E family transporter [Candidatus Nanoarchaeia archaeon]|nr:AI-2E family transporter [Candidatus Nanoarchaeia archaeon]
MKNNNKLLLFIGVILFAIFLIYLSSSFYQLIVLSLIIAYLVHPLKKKLMEKISSENIASALSLLIGSLLISFFLIILLISLYNSVSGIKNILAKSQDFELAFLSITLLKDINLSQLLTTAGLNQIFNIIQFIILIVPNLIINIVIFIVLLFYFIKYWEDIISVIKGLVPPGEIKYFNIFFSKIDVIMKSIFQTQFLTALIQSIIIFIFLLFLQVPYSFELTLFTFIMCFLSITSMVVPVGVNLYYLYLGITTGDFMTFIITLAFSGFIFIIDDFIKPAISKKLANTNPVVFLLGVFGGLSTLGFTGFIIGPLITTSLYTLFQIAYTEKID